jgi:hypothetical protein
MRRLLRGLVVSAICAACGAGGCAGLCENETTYNPYVRNNGDKPVLRATEDVLNAPDDALNEFDRRFERTVY